MENLQIYNYPISDQAETIAAIMAINGFTCSADHVQSLLKTHSFHCTDTIDKIITRVIWVYSKIKAECQGGNVTFDQNNFAKIVKAIDLTPHLSGYMYDKKLHQDCKILFPEPVQNDSFWEDVIAPIQRFHANSLIVSNPLVITGLSLYLITMLSSIDQKKQLESFNFAPVIRAAFFPINGIIDTLPRQIANSISLEHAIREDVQTLLPAGINYNIEEEVDNV